MRPHPPPPVLRTTSPDSGGGVARSETEGGRAVLFDMDGVLVDVSQLLPAGHPRHRAATRRPGGDRRGRAAPQRPGRLQRRLEAHRRAARRSGRTTCRLRTSWTRSSSATGAPPTPTRTRGAWDGLIATETPLLPAGTAGGAPGARLPPRARHRPAGGRGALCPAHARLGGRLRGRRADGGAAGARQARPVSAPAGTRRARRACVRSRLRGRHRRRHAGREGRRA